MTSLHNADGSANQFGAEMNPALDFLQTFDANGDPVEAYFECISQCSLDDGECVTVCTTILREKS